MKHKVLIFAILLTVLAVSQNVNAFDFVFVYQGKPLYYTINSDGNTVSIVSPNGSSGSSYVSGDLVIPDSVVYNGTAYAVTTIEYYAFSGCNGLTSVSIPNTVTRICGGAFNYCTSLGSITIPNSVTVIESGIFRYCTNLASVILPVSITSIPSNAFEDCTSLLSIDIPPTVTSIEYRAFENCTSLTSVVIPNSVTTIGESAFSYCTSLSSVTLPDSIMSISQWAFSSSGLTSLTIPTTVTYIGYGAFAWCNNLTSLVIPASVLYIDGAAFNYCSNLISIEVDADNPVYDSRNNCNAIIQTEQNKLIQGCRTTVIPNTVTTLGYQSFCYCYGLSTIEIPNSVTTIENSVFAYSDIVSVVIPESVTSLGEDVFSRCHSLRSVKLPNSITRIRSSAFYECISMKSITLPESITYIENSAFWQCSFDTIFLKSTTPPGWGGEHALVGYNSPRIFIPCGSYSAYSVPYWGSYYWTWFPLSEYLYHDFTCNFTSSNIDYGTVTYTDADCDSNLVLTAIPGTGFQLIGWSDGGTGNPRTIHLTSDTSVTAIFDYIPYAIVGTACRQVYETDFENAPEDSTWTLNNGSYMNKWYINTLDDTNRALFVSNDGGLSNNYTETQSSHVFAYTDLTLSAGRYTFNYDWRCNGEPYYDYLRVALMPEGASFSSWYYSSLPSNISPLDGGSQLVQQSTWQTHSDTASFPTDGVYRLTFLWHSDQHTYANPAPAIDNIWAFCHTPMGDTVGVVLGGDTVHYGDSLTLTAIPAMGYHFRQWSDGDTTNPRRVCATSDSLFEAVFSPDRFELALNVDTAIHGTVSGAGHYFCHEARTISATPAYGYHFTAWSDGSTANPRTFILSHDTTLTAYFDKNGYSVAAQSANTSMGYAEGSGSVLYLDSITLTARALYGYHFTQWNDGETANPRSLQVISDTLFTAFFAANNYTVTVQMDNATQGTVKGGGTTAYLGSLYIYAIPATGYHFSHWSDGSTESTRTITVTQDSTLTAYFEINSYQLTVLPNDASLGSVTGSGSYSHGTQVTVTAIPAQGNRFDRWSDNTLLSSRTITLISDLQLVAVFVPVDTVHVHDTTTLHDTTYVDVPYAVHDTTYLEVHDTTYVDVHDTSYIDVPYAVHDTTYVPVHDTTYIDVPYAVHDTTVVTDTVTLTEYVPVHDTIYVDVPYPIHDTTYIDVPYAVHDTTIVTDTLTEYVAVHDTTYINVPYEVHDTTYIDVHDTTYVDVFVHDTTYIDVPYEVLVHDTTMVVDTVTLTEYVPVHDTTYIDVPYAVHDTTYITLTDTVTNTVYDTVTNTVYDTVDNYIYDTTFLHDTTLVTDTLWVYDTIYIHDTVYVSQEGVGDVEAAGIKLYQRDGCIVVEGDLAEGVQVYDAVGRLLSTYANGTHSPVRYASTPSNLEGELRIPVPASGVYLVKIGDRPARRVVVMK